MKKRKVLFSLICSAVLALALPTTVQAADDAGNQSQSSSVQNSQQSSSNTQSSSTSAENTQSSQNNNSEQNQNKQNSNKASSQNIQNNNNKASKQNNVNKTPAKTPVKKSVKKNILPSGWQNKNGKRYYLNKGKVSKGLKKINNSWYLFDRTGAMLKNVRKIPHQNSYGYFDNQGRRRMSNTSTGRAYYWIDKTGKITGIKNNANVVCQRPEMPTGCEITAVTMMLNFAGVKVSKFQAAKIMPRSSDPNRGFIGSPYKEFPLGYWVAPNGVKPVVKHYLGTAKVMTNCTLDAIKKKLIRSHLVVVWVGWFDGFSNHALTLTGYHGNTLYYNDPWTGTKRAMSVDTFLRHWALDGHRAISY